MARRPLSPAARVRLHDGCFWGAAALALVAVVVAANVDAASPDLPGLLGFAVVLLLAAAGLVVAGVRSRRAARRFNDWDDAFADALGAELDQLRRHGRETAYAAGSDAIQIGPARVLEAERLFDQQTSPFVRPAPWSGGGSTTRPNVMGDATFAVLETCGPHGRMDTVRVLAPSAAAAVGWLDGVVGGTAAQLGGPRTHTGATMLGWRPGLVQTFRPGDVSYLSDRLRASVARPAEQQDAVAVRGTWVGRNALLAAEVQLGSEPPLHVMPLGFPALLGRAVGIAARRADAVLEPAAPLRAVTDR